MTPLEEAAERIDLYDETHSERDWVLGVARAAVRVVALADDHLEGDFGDFSRSLVALRELLEQHW